MKQEVFVARVGDDGRITIAKDVREKLGIRDKDFVQVAIVKLDLYRTSIHRLYNPRRERSMVATQVSATKFAARAPTRQPVKKVEPVERPEPVEQEPELTRQEGEQ